MLRYSVGKSEPIIKNDIWGEIVLENSAKSF